MRIADRQAETAEAGAGAERAAAHVREGIGLAALAMGLLVLLQLAGGGRIGMGVVHLAIVTTVCLLALFGGSRLARWLAVYAQLSFAVGGAMAITRAVLWMSGAAGERWLAVAIGVLQLVAAFGLWRAAGTSEAQEWLDAREEARRARRRPRPLDDWRRRAR